MKKITIILLAMFVGFCYADAQSTNVPYTLAKRYFVRNDYPERNLHMLKITDDEKFNSIFGMATVMGEDGRPTNIDFSKSYVIALIDDINNRTESIGIKSLTKQDNELSLVYQVKTREKASSAMFRICEIVIVDKQYTGTVHANSVSSDGRPLLGGDSDEYGCKGSTGVTWSELEKNCIHPWMTKYKLNGKEINGSQNASLIFSEDGTKAEILGSKYGNNIILVKQANKNVWVKDDLTLTETTKDNFSFKEKDKEIAKGSLRKAENDTKATSSKPVYILFKSKSYTLSLTQLAKLDSLIGVDKTQKILLTLLSPNSYVEQQLAWSRTNAIKDRIVAKGVDSSLIYYEFANNIRPNTVKFTTGDVKNATQFLLPPPHPFLLKKPVEKWDKEMKKATEE